MRLAIFDLDGTLVDAFADIRAAVNHALARQNLPTHDVATIRSYVGNGLRQLCVRSLPPGEEDRLEDVFADTRAYYIAHPADHARPYPGVVELLGRLRAAGWRTAVLSNKAHVLVTSILEELGLAPHLDAIMGEQAGIPIKPDPAAIHLLQQQFAAEMVVMVGDGLPDALAARAAGVTFVGVLWGIGTEAHLAPLTALPLTHDVAELEKVLVGLAGTGDKLPAS